MKDEGRLADGQRFTGPTSLQDRPVKTERALSPLFLIWIAGSKANDKYCRSKSAKATAASCGPERSVDRQFPIGVASS